MLVSFFDKINTILNIIRIKVLYKNRIFFGKNITIRGKLNVRISKDAYIKIGNNCFFNNNCSINAKKSIVIGDNCLFGESVKLYDHNHIYNLKNKLIKNSGYKIKEIKIGNNCWICSNVIILNGSIISNNCVISASSIVNSYVDESIIFYSKEKQKKINYE